jgi:flagellar hook protein FlgE
MNLGGNFAGPVTLNLGAYGQPNGLIQTSSGTINNQSDSTDGIAQGTYSDTEITDDGFVRASYRNGQQRDFYRIPNGYVRSPNGLEAVSGTAFHATADSGAIQLKSFGVTAASSIANGGAGTTSTDSTRVGAALVANAVEQSNTDLSSELTTLIVAQRTYSANSKVVTTADELTQTVLGLKN